MSINATLFVQAIVFAILVWFTMKFVWPPIATALDERANKIADGLAAADRAKAELSSANKRVEDELSDLLAAQVEVRIKKRLKRAGRVEEMGELSIQFGSLEALNGLIDRLRGSS